jgi:hypothetical protein
MRRRIARSRARCQHKAPVACNRQSHSPDPKPRAGQQPAHRTQPAITLWRAAESQIV